MIKPIDEAIKIASRSMNKKHLTGCVIANGNGVISNGWAHTGQWRRSNLYSVHAEIHALMRGKHQFLEGATAHIACVAKKSGNVRNALPCLSCATALIGYGIEHAEYTIPTIGGYNTLLLYLPDAIETAQLKVYHNRK